MGPLGSLIRDENLGWAVASERIPDTHPAKALGGDCSLLRFRGWHLSFYLFVWVGWVFLSPRYISPLAKLIL